MAMDLSRRGFIKLSAGAAAAGGTPAAAGDASALSPPAAGGGGGGGGGSPLGSSPPGVVPQPLPRLFGFVHIASIGLAGGLAPGEMLNIEYANVEACAKAVAENADLALGVKVRITD